MLAALQMNPAQASIIVPQRLDGLDPDDVGGLCSGENAVASAWVHSSVLIIFAANHNEISLLFACRAVRYPKLFLVVLKVIY